MLSFYFRVGTCNYAKCVFCLNMKAKAQVTDQENREVGEKFAATMRDGFFDFPCIFDLEEHVVCMPVKADCDFTAKNPRVAVDFPKRDPARKAIYRAAALIMGIRLAALLQGEPGVHVDNIVEDGKQPPKKGSLRADIWFRQPATLSDLVSAVGDLMKLAHEDYEVKNGELPPHETRWRFGLGNSNHGLDTFAKLGVTLGFRKSVSKVRPVFRQQRFIPFAK